jgi:aerobic C4-dicarboxylate transport protein
MTVDAPAPATRRDRNHILYISVLVAMVLGIAVGFLFPEVGKDLRPLGTGFVALIQMMIAPVIFCTIVLGVGSIRRAAQVGGEAESGVDFVLGIIPPSLLNAVATQEILQTLPESWSAST